MDQKKEKTGQDAWKRLVISAAVLAAARFIGWPLGALLNRAARKVPSLNFDFVIIFRLLVLLASLSLFGAACSLILRRKKPGTGHGKTMVTLAESAVRYLLVLGGLLWGLSILGVDVRALLAGAGVVALIIGFGAESLIADVITGIFMLFEHQYEVGDIIVVGDFRGTVTQIGIRTTSITDVGGNVKIINNSDIRSLINRSADTSVAVCDLGVPYSGEAVRKAEEVLKKTIAKLYADHTDLFREEPRYMGVQELNISENAAILRVVAPVAEENIYTVQRLLNRELMLALDDAGCGSPTAEIVVSHQD